MNYLLEIGKGWLCATTSPTVSIVAIDREITMGREICFSEADFPSVEKPPLEQDGGGVYASNATGNRILEREDSETKAGSIMRDLDPWTALFYTPHTVTVLIIGACLLVYTLCPFVYAYGGII